MGVQETDPLSQLSLPPGFRFYPTDEEILVQYLCRKVAGHHFNLEIIGEVDLYKFDPWVLPSKAMFGEKEWYFFSPRDRKYPNGSRPNRVAGSGYWKATGTDKVITTEGRKVGIKKALVFYIGKAPKGTKTNWIMHEYRLSESPPNNRSSRLDEWVLCRIYKKKSSGASKQLLSGVHSKESSHGGSSESSSSQFDDVLESLPEVDDRHFRHTEVNLQNLGSGSFDWATLAGLRPISHSQAQPQFIQAHENVNNNNVSNVEGQNNDMSYVPSFTGMRHVDEEVQSGLSANRVDYSGFLQQPGSSSMMSQRFNQNSVDPFGIQYPTQMGNVGYRQ